MNKFWQIVLFPIVLIMTIFLFFKNNKKGVDKYEKVICDSVNDNASASAGVINRKAKNLFK